MLKNAQFINEKIVIADEQNTTKKFCKPAQVGVDLSVKSVERFIAPGATLISKTYAAKTEPIPTSKITYEGVEFEGWFLEPDSYIIKLNEGCSFKENTTGLIFLRSSLNRSGVDIVSAVWDPGYVSVDGDEIYPMSIRMTVHNKDGFFLEKNARVAQLLVLENEDTTLYDGQWQGGRTTSKLVKEK